MKQALKDKLRGAMLASGVWLLADNTTTIASNIVEIFKVNSALLGIVLLALFFFWK